jgi:hypothetical protein
MCCMSRFLSLLHFCLPGLPHQLAYMFRFHYPGLWCLVYCLGMVLSVCTCWFHNMVTLPTWLVSTDFGTCSSYQSWLPSSTPSFLHILKCNWGHTLSCRLMYSFANIGHADIMWSAVSSNWSQNLHLLSFSVCNIFVYYYYYYYYYYYCSIVYFVTNTYEMCTLVLKWPLFPVQIHLNVFAINHKHLLSFVFFVSPVWAIPTFSLYTVTNKQCTLYYCLPSIDLCSTQCTFSVTVYPLRRNTARLITKRHLSSPHTKMWRGIPYISPFQSTTLWNVKLLSKWMRLFTENSKS